MRERINFVGRGRQARQNKRDTANQYPGIGIGSRLEPLERRRGDLPRSLTRAIDLALLPVPEQFSIMTYLR